MAIITSKDSRLRAIGHVVKTSLRRGKDSRKSQKLAPARGLTIVHNPPGGVSAAADIVAIHGLDGSFDSWTVGQRENWLTERLPIRFSPTRIITFSYDANVLDGYELTRRVVDGSAYRLAEDLSVLREETDSRRRPIIFIAHSMGGLIVKRALVSCHESTDPGFRDIGQSTAAVHFFGTPSSELPSHLFHEALRNTAMVQRSAGKQDRQFNSNSIPRPPSEAQSKWLELQLQPFKPLIACMEAYTYYESKETPGIGLVNAHSLPRA
jgi:pimeloyl-ACP methyl ester carboxylesterase